MTNPLHRPMRSWRSLLPGLVLGLLLPALAHAHANIESSDPAASAAVEPPPARVRITFTEAVEPRFTEIEVFDAARRRVDTGDLRAEDTRASVGLRDLPDGTYTVSWRNVSAVDGHATSGSFAFGVGDAPPPVAAGPAESDGDGTVGGPLLPSALVRALNFVAMAALLGAFGFGLLVLDPTLRALTPVPAPAPALAIATASGAPPGGRQTPDEAARPEGCGSVPDADRGVRAVARAALAALAVASLGSLLLQAIASAGDASLAALPGAVSDVLGTQYGTVWLARAAFIAALAALLVWPRVPWARALPWVAGLVLGSGVLLTTSLASHGAAAAVAEHVHTLDASPLTLAGGHALHALFLGGGVALWAVLSFPRARRALPVSAAAVAAVGVFLAAGLPVALDWLHLLAMALWVGGLVQLALVLPRILRSLDGRGRSAFVRALVPRFSRLALPCVAALVATGVYAAWLHVPEPAALTGTMYGVTILCKVALLLPLLALGAANMYLGSGQVRRLLRWIPGGAAASGFSSRLLRIVRLELLLASLILLATGVLTSIQPSAETVRAAPAVAFSESRETDAGILTLSVDPAAAGVNRIEVLLEEDGRPVTDASRVAVRFALESAGVGQSESLARAVGDGRYALTGPQLGLPGEWEVEVVARRPGQPDARGEFSVPVSPPRVVERAGVRAVLRTVPSRPVSGAENALELRVTDARGRSIPGARISLVLLMPAHAHFEDPVLTDLGGGRYAATARLDMVGEWLAQLQVQRPGRPPATLEIRFDVREAQP